MELRYAQWSRSVRNVELYGKPGLTYTQRTTSNFATRILPSGSLFSQVAPVFLSGDLESGGLGFFISRCLLR